MYKYAAAALAAIFVTTAVRRIGIGSVVDEVHPILHRIVRQAKTGVDCRTYKIHSMHPEKMLCDDIG